MIADSDAVFRALLEDPSLLKCVGVARQFNGYELSLPQPQRERMMRMAKESIVEAVARGLVDNGFIQLIEEPVPGGININGFAYVVDPKAHPLRENQKILTL